MRTLSLRVAGRAVAVTEEQARWLAEELHALAPLDPAHAGAVAVAAIERSLAPGAPQPALELDREAVRLLLMVLEDLAEGPEPFAPLQELHDVLVDVLL